MLSVKHSHVDYIKDAKACYKVNQLVLVNLDIIDEYLETFCSAGEKDKILSFNDYSHRQKEIVAGENYLYWVHDFVF